MSIEDVLFNIVEKKIRVSKEDILSRSRRREIVDARRIYAVVLLRSSGLIPARVCDALGRDRGTIIFHNKRHDILVKTDRFFRDKFESINKEFKELMKGTVFLEIKLSEATEEKERLEKEILNIKNLIKIKNEQLSAI